MTSETLPGFDPPRPPTWRSGGARRKPRLAHPMPQAVSSSAVARPYPPGQPRPCEKCGGQGERKHVGGVAASESGALIVRSSWVGCGECHGSGERPSAGHYADDGCNGEHTAPLYPCAVCDAAWSDPRHLCTFLANGLGGCATHHPYIGTASLDPEVREYLGEAALTGDDDDE